MISHSISTSRMRCFGLGWSGRAIFLRTYSSKPPKSPQMEKGESVAKGRMIPKKMMKSRIRTNDAVLAHPITTAKASEPHNELSAPSKFISFKDFPKAPQEILDQSLEQLYTSINLKPWVNTNTVSEPSEEEILKKKPENFVDFTIPDKFLKSKANEEITSRDRALVEELDNFLKADDVNEVLPSQLNLIKLYYDQNTNSFQPYPEHTLKRSLLGMINLNPCLNDIDDKYLWKLFPEHKLFGVPPFEEGSHGFKKWEREMLEKEKEAKIAKEDDQRELTEFESALKNSKSFFTKPKKGSRRKLDRKLLKKYKKLKEEGKIPKEFITDGYDLLK
ncbi:uncharacterized protein PRCAT00004101001 [Priceomyces carsonii]|uniref:uncharacterized protein n=1 Tax=Priceomyces carsonii TaxID=28549 RepID=UPI002EDACF01|nr:unnamed protein product [Priceomyces carsonii]